jgi:hypothetical protein
MVQKEPFLAYRAAISLLTRDSGNRWHIWLEKPSGVHKAIRPTDSLEADIQTIADSLEWTAALSIQTSLRSDFGPFDWSHCRNLIHPTGGWVFFCSLDHSLAD